MPDLAKCSANVRVESIVRNEAVDQREARVMRLLHSVCNRVNANRKNLPGQLRQCLLCTISQDNLITALHF